MWSQFYLISVLLVALLYLPGYFAFRFVGFDPKHSVCLAPLVSLSAIALVGQLYALVDIPSSPVSVLAPVLLIPLALFVAARVRGAKTIEAPDVSLLAMGICFVLGLGLGRNLIISRLGSPDALFQAYDVTQHLNIIRSMAESGKLTSLGVSPYMTAADAAIAPIDYSGFYPAGWHSLCALVVMASGASVTLVINASMFVFGCIVFPLAMMGFLALIFKGDKNLQITGSLFVLAFEIFPWGLLAYGPVYANVAGYCLMPAAMAVFALFVSQDLNVPQRVRLALSFVLGVLGLALCHPNTIFTSVVLLSPLCVHRILEEGERKGLRPVRKLLGAGLFILFVIVFWVGCYHLPMLQETVSHVWKTYAWAWQSIVNIVTVAYCHGFNNEIAAQIILGVLIIIGAVGALYSSEKRWMAVSYLLVCYILLISATHSDELKQILAGFWYTDPMRLATNCAVAAIPLATLGADWLRTQVVSLFESYNAKLGKQTHALLISCVLAILFIVTNFMPEFNLAGLHHVYSELEVSQNTGKEYRNWTKTFHTTFGDYRALASEVYSYNAPLDKTEEVFLSKVEGLIEDGALVINDPLDGSFLTYGTDGLRVYYRNFTGFDGEGETEESKLIRLHLCEYAKSGVVQDAVEAVDAQYVLVMRDEERFASFINMRGNYDQNLFLGITSIDENTPGFTCLYNVGSMALYKIDRE